MIARADGVPTHSLKRAIRWQIARTLLALGVPLRLKTEDRKVLEGTIFPYFAGNASFRKVLFVGCDWYTKQYERMFAGAEYATLEIDPQRVIFATKRHVVASVVDVAKHFAPGELDVIFCNGVLGWGLDDPAEAETAMNGCFTTLRPGGILVVSWDDLDGHRFPIGDLRALERFEAWTFPPLECSTYLVANEYRHTFVFLRKPG
jgi:SAM-dependent methyltransferase